MEKLEAQMVGAAEDEIAREPLGALRGKGKCHSEGVDEFERWPTGSCVVPLSQDLQSAVVGRVEMYVVRAILQQPK